MSETFYEMVFDNLAELAVIFNIKDDELLRCIVYAERLGWLAAKPSTIALVLIRIVCPDISNSTIYHLGNTELQTMRKWTCICCEKLKIKNIHFKKKADWGKHNFGYSPELTYSEL